MNEKDLLSERRKTELEEKSFNISTLHSLPYKIGTAESFKDIPLPSKDLIIIKNHFSHLAGRCIW